MDSPSHSLIGQFFLTFDPEGRLEYQGQIVDCPDPGFFTCQFFSALTGQKTHREIKQLSQILAWKFYDSADDWRSAFASHCRSDR
jgi:hypothetical protein